MRCWEKTIPFLSRGHLVDLVEGEPSKKMDLSPEGRGHAQRRPPLLSGFDQACSEILGSEFSILVSSLQRRRLILGFGPARVFRET